MSFWGKFFNLFGLVGERGMGLAQERMTRAEATCKQLSIQLSQSEARELFLQDRLREASDDARELRRELVTKLSALADAQHRMLNRRGIFSDQAPTSEGGPDKEKEDNLEVMPKRVMPRDRAREATAAALEEMAQAVAKREARDRELELQAQQVGAK